jgi:hypothetical protein
MDLTIADLAPWAKRAFEEAYDRRVRDKASRADLAEGFIAALLYARSWSSFRDADAARRAAGALKSA